MSGKGDEDVAAAAQDEKVKIVFRREIECGDDLRLGFGAHEKSRVAADFKSRQRRERNVFPH